MKPLLAFLGGFCLSGLLFFSGVALAIAYLTAEPPRGEENLDVAGLWSTEPRRVNVEAQQLARVDARPASPADEEAPVSRSLAAHASERDLSEDEDPGIDPFTTAALPSEAEEGQPSERARRQELIEAHVDWCANRYRSYRPRDNAYTPYRGGRRPCVSPYSAEISGEIMPDPGADGPYASPGADDGVIVYDDEMAAGPQVSQAHIARCFSRYRSYDPRDNTYQPYGGGPRRQCR